MILLRGFFVLVSACRVGLFSTSVADDSNLGKASKAGLCSATGSLKLMFAMRWACADSEQTKSSRAGQRTVESLNDAHRQNEIPRL